jgi:chromosome partitioning protein
MRKIAVINFKGGTGKTTTVVNIGAGLAMRSKRVLLVDVDAQGGVALSLGLSYVHSLADALTGAATIWKCITKAREGLDVIPSDGALPQAQRAISRYVNYSVILSDMIQPLESDYDFIILDCAASITLLNINALTYASEIFIPTQVEFLSLAGLNQVLENLARVRFPNQPRQSVSNLGISLIIPTMYDVRKRQSRRLLAELREAYGQHVAHPIRTNVRLSEAPACQKTIYEYAPDSPGAFDYNRLVDLILQETLLAGEKPIGLQNPLQPTQEESPVTLVEAPPTPEEAPPAEPAAVVAAAPGPMGPAPAAIPRAAPALCPYCGIPLTSLSVAGYRVYQCDHCGYQKQVLLRDLRAQ